MHYRIQEISSVGAGEYVTIVSHYNNVDEEDEADVLRKRGYSEEQIKYTLKSETKPGYSSLDVTFDQKQKLIHPLFGYFITLYMAYKNGILPYAGSLSEQPSKIMEVFNILDSLQAEKEAFQRKQIEKENKKRG